MANLQSVRSFALRLVLASGVLALPACAHKSTAKAPDADTSKPASPATTPSSPPIGGYSINDANFLELGYRRDWTAFPYLTQRQRLQSVVPAGDLVLTQETGSTVTGLESSNGAMRWANELASPLTRFVGLNRDGEKVLVSADSELFVLSSVNGDVQSRQRYARVVNTAPIVFGNSCIYGTTTGHVLAHRIDLGVTKWSFLLRGAIDHKPVLVGPLEADDAIIGAISQAGQYVFVSAKSGRPLGRGEIFGGLDTDPVAAQGLMVAAGRDQSLWGLRPSGDVAWRIRCDQPLKRQPSTDGKTVWAQLGNEGLSAVDGATGKIIWSNRVVEGTVVGIRGGNLLVWNGSLALLLDKDRGDIIRSFVIPQTVDLITDKFEDGNLYAISDGGVLVRFVPRN
ncbi:MAG: PQQ-binding-like beta-propeller repeat protein [Planctomycetes bacterium]|nr:PQQ-binding-like beta-propeller repeat protein [Planctomycetota bacterium]